MVMSHDLCHVTQAGAWLAGVSEDKLNTDHQCSMRDVKILDREENWHRGKSKRPLIYLGEAGFKQRHWSGTPMLQLVSHGVSHVTRP